MIKIKISLISKDTTNIVKFFPNGTMESLRPSIFMFENSPYLMNVY